MNSQNGHAQEQVNAADDAADNDDSEDDEKEEEGGEGAATGGELSPTILQLTIHNKLNGTMCSGKEKEEAQAQEEEERRRQKTVFPASSPYRRIIPQQFIPRG